MSNLLEKDWRALQHGRPGHRFQARYAAGKKARKDVTWSFKILRVCRTLIALGAIAVGVVLIFMPGPAILFFFIAGGLLASESLAVARFLDWTELKGRVGLAWLLSHWGKLRLKWKIAVMSGALGVMAGCGYAAYRVIIG